MSLLALPASAQFLSSADIDGAARASKQNSIMFQEPLSYEEQARRAYEEEQARQQQAYEEEMRRREEEIRKAEEERRKALRPVNLFGNTFKIYAEVNGEVITNRYATARQCVCRHNTNSDYGSKS